MLERKGTPCSTGKVNGVTRLVVLVPASMLMLTASCATKQAPPPAPPVAAGTEARPVTDRLVTRRASIAVRVTDVAAAAGQVEGIVTQAEGFVAESSRSDGDRASFVLRVPAARLEAVLDRLAALGRATERTVSARDVTDQTLDLEARLQNKRALRERLRGLLGSTATLQEVLTLEEHLARLQADIDTLEGQLARLRSEVALSQVSLTLERDTRLGPLGYLFRGLLTGIRKLFVW
jgi:hypothetical protein